MNKIETLYRNKINTVNGIKESLRIKLVGNPNWLSCWAGNWNKDWAVGTEIEFTKDRVKANKGKDGKTYYNLSAPAEARFQGVSRQEFEALVSRVRELEENLLKPEVEPEIPGTDLSEISVIESEAEVNVDDIPF